MEVFRAHIEHGWRLTTREEEGEVIIYVWRRLGGLEQLEDEV
jgi:hypothetical protein